MPEPSAFPLAPPPFDGASRRVDPGACFDWLRQGWALFAANPGVWLAVAVIALVVYFGLGIVPLVGGVAANLLLPVLTAGLLDLARRQSRGETIEIGGLFAGFQKRTGELVILGLIATLALIALALLAGILVGGGLAGGAVGISFGRPAAFGAGLLLGSLFLGGLLLALALLPLTMALWFAPALVFFNGMPPKAAMKASFAACLLNWLPLLVYGVILFVLAFFAALPLGLGFLVLLPVLAGALEASLRDVFPTA